MGARLVIPEGDDPQKDGPREDFTWAQMAAEARVDAIEQAGSAWCVENEVTGLGMCSELVPVAPAPELIPAVDPSELTAAATAVQAATTVATLKAAVLKLVAALG